MRLYRKPSPPKWPAAGDTEVEQLPWPRLAALAPRTIGLLPLGAACKEHGYHLPLGTDALQARWIASRVAARRPALCWPLLAYGYYPAFLRYPGSASVGEGAFRAVLDAALEAMQRAGHPLAVVLNTGISTTEAVDRACAEHGALACHVYAGKRFRAAVSTLSEQRGGGHADEVETSLVMHMQPQAVDLSQACDESATHFVPGPLNPDHPGAANHSPSGAMGNPTLASAAKGRQLAAALVADVLARLDEHWKRVAAPTG